MNFTIRSLNAGKFLDFVRSFAREKEIIIPSMDIFPDETDRMKSIIRIEGEIVEKMDNELVEKLFQL